jgi:triosephosphate isomerase
MIIVNFKEYVKGQRAINLAIKIRKFLPRATLCVRWQDLGKIDNVWLQELPLDKIDEAKKLGVKGTLLNHNDHLLSPEVLKKSISACDEAGLKVIVCVKTLSKAKSVLRLKPGAIAFEPPALIGSGKSVTKYDANRLRAFSSLMDCSGSYGLCGAGISNSGDYHAALKMGCKGVLISSAIAKNKRVEGLLRDLSMVR